MERVLVGHHVHGCFDLFYVEQSIVLLEHKANVVEVIIVQWIGDLPFPTEISRDILPTVQFIQPDHSFCPGIILQYVHVIGWNTPGGAILVLFQLLFDLRSLILLLA